MFRKRFCCVVFAALALAGAAAWPAARPAWAQNGPAPPAPPPPSAGKVDISRVPELSDLNEGLPLDIEDAEPTRPGEIQFLGTLRYERTRGQNGENDDDRFPLRPTLQLGLRGGLEAVVSAHFVAGSSERTGSGDVSVSLLGQLARERRNAPALALSGRVTFPAGEDSEGYDTQLEFIASRSLDASAARPRVHLNLAWRHNDKAQPGERGDGYLALLGYSQEIRPGRTAFVAELLREQELTEGQTQNFAGAGLIQQLSENSEIALGANVGIGRESPRGRLTFAFLQGF